MYKDVYKAVAGPPAPKPGWGRFNPPAHSNISPTQTREGSIAASDSGINGCAQKGDQGPDGVLALQ